MGRSQVVKAPDFDSGMRRFESYRPSQYQLNQIERTQIRA